MKFKVAQKQQQHSERIAIPAVTFLTELNKDLKTGCGVLG